MAEIDCMVATPEGPVFAGKARSVIVPAVDGELGILPRHAPLVAALGCGELRIDEVGGGKKRYFLAGGFVQVLNNRVSVLATETEAAESIDREAAARRLEEVRAGRPPKSASLEESTKYREALERAEMRRKVAG